MRARASRASGDRAPFLHLDELVQTVLPGAIRHEPPGELVDDVHLLVSHEVVAVTLEEVPRGERLPHQLLATTAPGPHAGQRFGHLDEPDDARLGQPHGAIALVDRIVTPRRESVRKGEGGRIDTALVTGVAPSGDDQRRARLIDEHAVRLVDDGVAESPQHQLSRSRLVAGAAARAGVACGSCAVRWRAGPASSRTPLPCW